MQEKLYGLHPVLAAIEAGKRQIDSVYLSDSKSPAIRQIKKLAQRKQIPVKEISRQHLANLLPGAKHQGVIAVTSPLPTVSLEDLIANAWEQKEEPFLLYVDSVQDPHNLGAIIRSADAAGCQGLIVSQRQTVGLTPTVAKTSAGALEYLPITVVNSPGDSLQRMKEAGFWLVGLHPAGEKRYNELDLKIPLTILVGGEGVGLRPALRRHCDWLTFLPQQGHVNSLNTSVATALMLYEVRRQRNN